MRFRPCAGGVLFTLGVYLFGVQLTSANRADPTTNPTLFVLLGSNERVDVACLEDPSSYPCVGGINLQPSAALEIVSLDTDPPTLTRAFDLGVAIPSALAVAPSGARAYVVDTLNRLVRTVDTETGATLGSVSVPEGPVDCILSPDGATLYVTTLQPSVVAIDAAAGARSGEIEPAQNYFERLGGLTLLPGPPDRLAVAAASSAPALYLFEANGAALDVVARIDIPSSCPESNCPAGDDVVMVDTTLALVANHACHRLHPVDVSSFQYVSGRAQSFAQSACLPVNPQNSLVYDPVGQRAYLAFRGFAQHRPVAMPVFAPDTMGSTFMSGFSGTPESAALVTGGRALYIVRQDTPTSPLQLDRYDTVEARLSRAVYTFSAIAEGKAAIDAKVGSRSKTQVRIASASLTLPRGEGLLSGALRLGLLGFGAALWLRDRRRPRGGSPAPPPTRLG